MFKYVTINDKTIIFSYVFSFSIKLPLVIWICKDKTYNGRNDMGGSSAMGEGLQWFFSTIADLPEGRSAMGKKVCNITPQSRTYPNSKLKFALKYLVKSIFRFGSDRSNFIPHWLRAPDNFWVQCVFTPWFLTQCWFSKRKVVFSPPIFFCNA